jgi:cation diffusion facilitator CzcD-associated flavoprotein CzcO
MSSDAFAPHLDVAVIGAGTIGIHALHRLREVRSEALNSVGGCDDG